MAVMELLDLDPDRCYRAVQSRDARFDGRFFTAVLSTRVYCRPVCPARIPRRDRVRFFACAAAAAEAGFRPCLRCRPETAPGTPAWLGTAAVVSRAVRRIAEGALDRKSIDGLAAELDLGGRQLRRLFGQHLGASPVAVAQTRRVHFAKKMLDETPLPIGAIAAAAGFGSLRRFNFAFRAAYGRPPREIRRAARADASPTLELRLAFRPPLAFDALLAFLRGRAIPGVERVTGQTYARTVASGGERGVITVGQGRDPCHLRLVAPAAMAGSLLDLVARARRLFDLDADPAAIGEVLRGDPLLAGAVRARPGLRVPGAWDPFELGVRAILGQQVSVAGATTLSGRLVAAHGERLPGGGEGLTHLFPPPEALAKAPLERIGMPGSRAEAIRGFARAVAAGEPVIAPAAGLEVAMERLTALPGVGPWTAAYVAMRALGEPDGFPAGDLGLRRAVSGAVGSGPAASEKELLARAEAWRPWRAYAAMHLWTALDGGRRETTPGRAR
jgi:AraC family transcriptional regulator of adaptative response / DNA-3-methyladenine glycosylase II